MPKECKQRTYDKIHKFLDEFKTVVVAEIKDIPADQIHKIRKDLRAIDSEVLCGKSVLILPLTLRPSCKNQFKTT